MNLLFWFVFSQLFCEMFAHSIGSTFSHATIGFDQLGPTDKRASFRIQKQSTNSEINDKFNREDIRRWREFIQPEVNNVSNAEEKEIHKTIKNFSFREVTTPSSPFKLNTESDTTEDWTTFWFRPAKGSTQEHNFDKSGTYDRMFEETAQSQETDLFESDKTATESETTNRRNDFSAFISPNSLLPAELSPKEIAAIDLFMHTVSQLAQMAMVIGLLVPMLNLAVLPQFLLSVLTSWTAFNVLAEQL